MADKFGHTREPASGAVCQGFGGQYGGQNGANAAGGYYADGSHHHHGFVAIERNGAWDTAIQVPGLAAVNTGGRNTEVLTVSCAPAGSCAAGGFYTDIDRHTQGFVAVEQNGCGAARSRCPAWGS